MTRVAIITDNTVVVVVWIIKLVTRVAIITDNTVVVVDWIIKLWCDQGRYNNG